MAHLFPVQLTRPVKYETKEHETNVYKAVVYAVLLDESLVETKVYLYEAVVYDEMSVVPASIIIPTGLTWPRTSFPLWRTGSLTWPWTSFPMYISIM